MSSEYIGQNRRDKRRSASEPSSRVRELRSNPERAPTKQQEEPLITTRAILQIVITTAVSTTAVLMATAIYNGIRSRVERTRQNVLADQFSSSQQAVQASVESSRYLDANAVQSEQAMYPPPMANPFESQGGQPYGQGDGFFAVSARPSAYSPNTFSFSPSEYESGRGGTGEVVDDNPHTRTMTGILSRLERLENKVDGPKR